MPFLRPRCSHRLIFEYERNSLLPNTPDCVPRINFKAFFFSPPPRTPRHLTTAFSLLLSLYWAFYLIDGAPTPFCVFAWAWSGFSYT